MSQSLPTPEDHPVLDQIVTGLDASRDYEHYRESESVIFQDGHQWYEIVVRRIDPPDYL